MTLEVFKKFLKSESLKLTRTRRIIFEEILSARKVHPNAYDIYRSLKGKGHKVSLATIYRTLNLLVKSGLVSQIDLGEDHAHYEPEILQKGHGHLVCISCGRVKEFHQEEILEVMNDVGKKSKFKMDKFSIQVFGYCEDCQKK